MSVVWRRKEKISCEQPARIWSEGEAADLLVEYTVPFVDIRDVAFVFVEAFAGEFVSFVLAIERCGTEGSQ